MLSRIDKQWQTALTLHFSKIAKSWRAKDVIDLFADTGIALSSIMKPRIRELKGLTFNICQDLTNIAHSVRAN